MITEILFIIFIEVFIQLLLHYLSFNFYNLLHFYNTMVYTNHPNLHYRKQKISSILFIESIENIFKFFMYYFIINKKTLHVVSIYGPSGYEPDTLPLRYTAISPNWRRNTPHIINILSLYIVFLIFNI